MNTVFLLRTWVKWLSTHQRKDGVKIQGKYWENGWKLSDWIKELHYSFLEAKTFPKSPVYLWINKYLFFHLSNCNNLDCQVEPFPFLYFLHFSECNYSIHLSICLSICWSLCQPMVSLINFYHVHRYYLVCCICISI